jgi:tripartite-type tricarboxylate transporter receptor subunit TctC
VRLVVGFAAGSGNDVIAREVARDMSESLGQPVVVDNRVGAGGSIGTEVVARAAPDGYTIGLGTSSQMVMNVALYKNLPFDVEQDLRAIGLVAYTPLVLVVNPSMPRTLKELIAHARAHPGRVTYGSAGAGSISHIVAEAFAKAADVSLQHVPYKGNAQALVDIAGGHVDLMFDGFLASASVVQQGKARQLAVSGTKRSPLAPQVPTFAEEGLPRFEAATWNNLYAPAKTPPEVIERLNAALNRAMTSPGVRDKLAQGASDSLAPSTPAQADAYGRAQRAQWVPFVRALKIETS